MHFAINKFHPQISHSLKEISTLNRELSQLRDSLSNKDTQCLRFENELDECRKQLTVEMDLKKESNDRIQALRETLKVSQQENDQLQQRLTETEHRMGEEMEKLKSLLTNQQLNHEQRFRRSIEEKTQLEEKYKSELSIIEHNLRESRQECDNIRRELKETVNEQQKLHRKLENQMEKSTAEKQSLESGYNNRIVDLNRKLSDMENKLKSMTDKYETTYNEFVKQQNYVIGVENDLKSKNAEILNVHEKYNLLEMDRLTLLNETENIKRLLHLETVEKKEKSRQCDELNESLSSSQIEIEK